MIGGGNDHQLFVIDRYLLERRVRDRIREERGVQLAGQRRGCALSCFRFRSSSVTSG
jgi:hypothetical protein